MSIEVATASLIPSRLSPYAKFKMALKSKEVQIQYSHKFKTEELYCCWHHSKGSWFDIAYGRNRTICLKQHLRVNIKNV
jgi:hypothetical protein